MMGNVSTHARPASSTTRATEASLFLVRLICLGTQHEAHPAPAIESWRCNCTLSPSSAPTAILWHLSETLCETRDDGGPNPFLTQLGEQYNPVACRRDGGSGQSRIGRSRAVRVLHERRQRGRACAYAHCSRHCAWLQIRRLDEIEEALRAGSTQHRRGRQPAEAWTRQLTG
ncbi:hypothetical protein LIA77_08703 [Sarocladium implicatum]|nr:hypothetical protein LIA77_08703 [Sarocladium implicatum]